MERMVHAIDICLTQVELHYDYPTRANMQSASHALVPRTSENKLNTKEDLLGLRTEEDGATVLHACVGAAQTISDYPILQQALSQDGNIEWILQRDNSGRTALHTALECGAPTPSTLMILQVFTEELTSGRDHFTLTTKDSCSPLRSLITLAPEDSIRQLFSAPSFDKDMRAWGADPLFNMLAATLEIAIEARHTGDGGDCDRLTKLALDLIDQGADPLLADNAGRSVIEVCKTSRISQLEDMARSYGALFGRYFIERDVQAVHVSATCVVCIDYACYS